MSNSGKCLYETGGDSTQFHGRTTDEAKKIATYRESARAHLEDAKELCKLGFVGADDLAKAVESSLRSFGKDFHQEVTQEEIEAIKRAMFAIGERGMPMEQALCPQCNAPIGGTNHRAVAGVTRAMDMEK